MVNTLNFDISMTAGVRWSGSVGLYNPLSNGLADTASPLTLDGWHATLQIKDEEGLDVVPLLVIDDTDNGGITIETVEWMNMVVTADQTAALAGLVGYYDLRVTPTLGPDFDGIATAGRVYVAVV